MIAKKKWTGGPTGRKSSARLDEVVEGIKKIFLSEGCRALTMEELASRLNCSKRTIYEIAPSKKELFLHIVDIFLSEIREKGYAALAKCKVGEDRLTKYMAPGYLETAGVSSRFFEDIYGYRPALLLLEAHQRERMSTVERIVNEEITAKRFRPIHPRLVAETYLAAFEHINQPDILAATGLTYSEATSELYELFSHGLVDCAQTGGRKRW